jgi:threonine dehydrogenase-like Zn-dependent dehydrogenase
MKLIETGKYPFEKINNHTYQLEELPQALKDTEERLVGFIKGTVVF